MWSCRSWPGNRVVHEKSPLQKAGDAGEKRERPVVAPAFRGGRPLRLLGVNGGQELAGKENIGAHGADREQRGQGISCDRSHIGAKDADIESHGGATQGSAERAANKHQ
jgi:hypothetical protein